MRTHVEGWLVDEFMAREGSCSFWIKRENTGGWSLWCKVGSANLALLGSDRQRLVFERPEQCVALFRDHSGIEIEWHDFMERIKTHGGSNDIPELCSSLGDEKKWIGPGSSPSL
jgi:hypothetical protein